MSEPDWEMIADGLALFQEHAPQSGEDWVGVSDRCLAAGEDGSKGSPLFHALMLRTDEAHALAADLAAAQERAETAEREILSLRASLERQVETVLSWQADLARALGREQATREALRRIAENDRDVPVNTHQDVLDGAPVAVTLMRTESVRKIARDALAASGQPVNASAVDDFARSVQSVLYTPGLSDTDTVNRITGIVDGHLAGQPEGEDA